MKPSVFRGLAGVVCAASAAACGESLAGDGRPGDPEANLAALEKDAAVQRTYVGVSQDVHIGARPVVGTFDLLGGADVDVEIAAKNGAPLAFELWQIHVDHSATLAMTVDDRSGFALQQLHADEDSSWLLRFPPGAPADVVVDLQCDASTHGCTPFGQPGDACAGGWACDEGLTCQVPGETCVAP
jgi:hypothetical protein